MWWLFCCKMTSLQPCNFFVRHLESSKIVSKCQELSLCPFSSRLEKVRMENVTLSISWCVFSPIVKPFFFTAENSQSRLQNGWSFIEYSWISKLKLKFLKKRMKFCLKNAEIQFWLHFHSTTEFYATFSIRCLINELSTLLSVIFSSFYLSNNEKLKSRWSHMLFCIYLKHKKKKLFNAPLSNVW
jgi:hypothetical protein